MALLHTLEITLRFGTRLSCWNTSGLVAHSQGTDYQSFIIPMPSLCASFINKKNFNMQGELHCNVQIQQSSLVLFLFHVERTCVNTLLKLKKKSEICSLLIDFSKAPQTDSATDVCKMIGCKVGLIHKSNKMLLID